MIGGNITATLQLNTGSEQNAIGEDVISWLTVNTLKGYLDYVSGDAKFQTYDAKVAESTHLFICDYIALDSRIKKTGENSRILIGEKTYDVKLIDDVMELNAHYEIYLQYTGAQ